MYEVHIVGMGGGRKIEVEEPVLPGTSVLLVIDGWGSGGCRRVEGLRWAVLPSSRVYRTEISE